MIRRAILLALVVCLAGCTPGAVTSALDKVVSAVELALPLLSFAGVPAPVIVLAQGYLQSVSAAVNETTTELASTDTSAVKAAKIASYFAAAIVPVLPAGTPPIVAQLLQAVSDAVAAFLKHIAGGQTLVAGKVPEIKVTMRDRAALAKIKERNAQNIAKLAVH